MRVLVLGHKGMLGHVVEQYLRDEGYDVMTTDKRYVPSHDCQLLREVQLSDADFVINCIGKIRQKSPDPSELYLVNALLPMQLVQCLSPGQRLVQVSSDCVFSGRKATPYLETDAPDPTDAYGSSKAVSELIASDKRAIVLRTSIIGPELGTSYGLMAWFMNNMSSYVNGYTDHYWNGVTTLRLANVIRDSILDPLTPWNAGVTHITSKAPVSKYELLHDINKVWMMGKSIRPITTSQPINHELVGSIVCEPIEQQLLDLRQWSLKR